MLRWKKSYNHLKPEDRATVMLMRREGATIRSVARILGRAPSTISRELKTNCPDRQSDEAATAGERAREKRVTHETIYNALYVMLKGELRTELLGCLRQARRIRKPRARGEDRRGLIQDMVSLHVCPPEVEDRLILGAARPIS